MHSLLFEVTPHPGHEDHYLERAAALRPALERHAGLIALDRYRSLARPAVLLSSQRWHDEDAIARWRRDPVHRGAQRAGRERHFADYRLRISRVLTLRENGSVARGEPDTGERGTAAPAPAVEAEHSDVSSSAARLHLVVESRGEPLLGAPGDEATATEAFESVYDAERFVVLGDVASLEEGREALAALAVRPAFERALLARGVRDYGMFDRREAPPDSIDRVR